MSAPSDGATAMAVDEALVDACAANPAAWVPVLRLYQFAPPCLSLGRFQSVTDADLDRCRARGIDVVRRPTGGRAVLHERCLTYAIIAAAGVPPFAEGIRRSAMAIGGALALAVTRLGATVALAPAPPRGPHSADCFAVPGIGELTALGMKLAGSAQLRRGGAALQHGTIRLRADAGHAAPLLHESRHPRAPSDAAMASLDLLCGRVVSFAEAADAVAGGIASALDINLEPWPLPASIQAHAATLRRDRYTNPQWTMER